MRNKFKVYPVAKIGRWTAQQRITTGKLPRWHCVCDCGTELDIPYNTLLYGNTRSCGCKKRESDQKLSGRVSRVAGTSIDHLKSKKIPTNNTTGVKGVYQDKHGRFVARIAFQKKQ